MLPDNRDTVRLRRSSRIPCNRNPSRCCLNRCCQIHNRRRPFNRSPRRNQRSHINRASRFNLHRPSRRDSRCHRGHRSHPASRCLRANRFRPANRCCREDHRFPINRNTPYRNIRITRPSLQIRRHTLPIGRRRSPINRPIISPIHPPEIINRCRSKLWSLPKGRPKFF